MIARILAAASPGEVRVAVLADRLADYAVWRPGRPDGVGDLHRGRISAPMRALAGSFVALQGEALDGFLPDSELDGRALEGQLLGVRITRAAQNGKGARVTARLEAEAAALTEAGAARLVRRGTDPVRRFAAAYPEAGIETDDAGLLAALRPALGERVRRVAEAFPPALEDEVAALAGEQARLEGGGTMRIQPVAALTAIDVDMGGAGRGVGGGGKAGAHRDFNLGLIPELARQIRLRNLSGAILVDFAGLSTRRRAALGPALREALAADPTESRLLGFTGLGLAEIVRRRVHPPLHEMLAGPHAAMAAALRSAMREIRPGTRPVLAVAPQMRAAFEEDAAMQRDLAASTGFALAVQADPALAACAWRLHIGA